MEEETKNFLVLIMQTVSTVVLWMVINMFAGIYFKLGLFEGHPTLKNYIYYFFFLLSIYLLIKYFRKRWNF